MDCPPHIGAATSSAFLAADLVVIPVTVSDRRTAAGREREFARCDNARASGWPGE
jgi:hypothetical protein